MAWLKQCFNYKIVQIIPIEEKVAFQLTISLTVTKKIALKIITAPYSGNFVYHGYRIWILDCSKPGLEVQIYLTLRVYKLVRVSFKQLTFKNRAVFSTLDFKKFFEDSIKYN